MRKPRSVFLSRTIKSENWKDENKGKVEGEMAMVVMKRKRKRRNWEKMQLSSHFCPDKKEKNGSAEKN
jgi:hypothetical protein